MQSQALLQNVALRFSGSLQLPRLRSFCEWMLKRASQHVQHLNLTAATDHKKAAEESGVLLAAALAACGASGSLRELQLELNMKQQPFFCTSWLAALHSLRHLTISITGEVAVTASLAPLSALEELTLEGSSLQLSPTARLPASLTRLRLVGAMDSETLPSQVWSLR